MRQTKHTFTETTMHKNKNQSFCFYFFLFISFLLTLKIQNLSKRKTFFSKIFTFRFYHFKKKKVKLFQNHKMARLFEGHQLLNHFEYLGVIWNDAFFVVKWNWCVLLIEKSEYTKEKTMIKKEILITIEQRRVAGASK